MNACLSISAIEYSCFYRSVAPESTSSLAKDLDTELRGQGI